MADQADVKSIDTLAFVRTAFASFAHEQSEHVSNGQFQAKTDYELLSASIAIVVHISQLVSGSRLHVEQHEHVYKWLHIEQVDHQHDQCDAADQCVISQQ